MICISHSPYIFHIKSRRLGGAGHVAHVRGEKKGVLHLLFWWGHPPGRPRRRWEDIGWEGTMDWIHLA